MEEVSPDRPPTPGTPDIREESEERLPRLIEQAKEKEDSDSSGSSASFVYQDHCYSLPPQEEPPDKKDQSHSPSPTRDDHLYNKVQSEKVVKIKSKLKNVEPSKKKISKV